MQNIQVDKLLHSASKVIMLLL